MNPNNAAIFVKLHSDPKDTTMIAITTPVVPVINYLPLTFKAPTLGKAADVLATKAAIFEVNRAISAAYYNGIL